MKASINKMKREAVDRLCSLELDSKVYKDFLKNGTIYCSDELPEKSLKPITPETYPKLQAVINKFEAWQGFVYHVFRGYSDKWGEVAMLLFVSDDDEEWELERRDVKNMNIYSYIHFFDHPDLSKIGQIPFQKENGMLIC